MAMYIVVDPNQGSFVGTVESPNAIDGVKKLWTEYGRDTTYKLYREVGVYAYEVAKTELQTTDTNANTTPRKKA